MTMRCASETTDAAADLGGRQDTYAGHRGVAVPNVAPRPLPTMQGCSHPATKLEEEEQVWHRAVPLLLQDKQNPQRTVPDSTLSSESNPKRQRVGSLL